MLLTNLTPKKNVLPTLKKCAGLKNLLVFDVIAIMLPNSIPRERQAKNAFFTGVQIAIINIL
jgi:hypothetical protein